MGKTRKGAKGGSPAARRDATRRQVGALCYRQGPAGFEVLLITSRRTRRWIGPKGWPMKRRAPWEAAAIEAREEAGVAGRIVPRAIGSFVYAKELGSGRRVRCAVDVYPLEVSEIAESFPEAHERTRRWLPPGRAAEIADPPAFGRLIRRFARALGPR